VCSLCGTIEKEKTKLNNGTFDVFYGPIYDNEGNLRIAEGESMTDNAMLNEFNWYVEGVVIDE
jgi:basic membrane protein A